MDQMDKMEELKLLETKRKMRKRKRLLIRLLIIVVIVGFIGIGTVFSVLFSSNDCGLIVDKKVVIPKDSSISEIADILKNEHVISNKITFMARAVVSGKKNDLKYGEFTFKPDVSYGEVIETLVTVTAKRETVTVTIPEGYSAEMIIKKLTEAGLGTAADYEKAFNAEYKYDFVKHIKTSPECKYKLQGFLFPATYEFFKDATAEEVVNVMLKKFEEEYKKTGAPYDNISDVIIKASLVEREAKLDEERSLIAGVIENRLKAEMILQIDATVVYAKSQGLYNIERVMYEDLEIDSKYNTYKYSGLPVGPICNPGMKSIQAVLVPAVHEYLYYRTTEAGDGSHRFSATYDEHEQQVPVQQPQQPIQQPAEQPVEQQLAQ